MKSLKVRILVLVVVLVAIAGLIVVAALGPRIAATFGFRETDQTNRSLPGAGPQGPGAPPADCLLVVEATDVETFCSRLGEILCVMDERGAPDQLRETVGRLIGNPEFSGVSLEGPIRFFLMDPKKYSQPWVFQFSVSDARAAKSAAARWDGTPRTFFHVANGLAVRALSSSAGEPVVNWRRRNGGRIAFGIPGQLRLLLDVEKIMATYEDEIEAAIPAMKERMAEAMQRVENKETASRDAGAAQKELDTVMSLLRQIDTLSVAVSMEASRAEVAVDVKPLPGTALAGLARSHPAATPDLFSLCPPDAAVVIAQNLSAMDALKGLVGNVLGIREIGFLTQKGSAQSGQVVAALFMPSEKDGHAGVLELRGGARAADAEARWQELAAAPEAEDERPIHVVPIPVANTDETSVRIADVVLNEPVLGERGTNMIRNVFGPEPKASLARSRQGSVFCLGGSPLARVGEVLSLAEGGGASLAAEPAFSDVIEAAGCVPNLLVYVAPAGVHGWLWLAGFDSGRVDPDDEALAGWVSLGQDGTIRARLRMPTPILRRALFNDEPQRTDSGPVRPPISNESDAQPGEKLHIRGGALSPR